MTMTRTNLKETSGIPCWPRLVHLAFLLPAISDFLLNNEGSGGPFSTNKRFGSFFPTAYASLDKSIQSGRINRHRRNLQTAEFNDFSSVDSISDTAREKPCRKKSDVTIDTKSKRGQALGLIRTARAFCGEKIFKKNPLQNDIDLNKEKRNCLEETTRLVGGANPNFEAEEDPNEQNSSPLSNSPPPVSPDVIQRKESRIKSILPKSKLALQMNFRQTPAFVRKLSSKAGPSILTVATLLYSSGKKNDISLLTLYKLALLGASCGFHLFLHFITLGYALGITLPLIVALYSYQKQYELPLQTVLHSLITIFWGVRLFAFLAIREYATWPALHHKVVELEEKMNIPFASKILCWFLYSCFYVAMVASCWSRLLQTSSSSATSTWGILGYAGLSLQLVGLSLETIADLQKNSFKSCYKHSWCNVGIWKYSTHPNYLGEGIFWWGTYLAHGFHSPFHSVLATIGLMFILYVLKGSTNSLSSKQKEKYGQEADFYKFQRTHNVFGPKQMWSRQQVETGIPLHSDPLADDHDNAASTAGNEHTQKINQ